MTRAEAQAKIDAIDEILDAGVQSTSIGDRTVTYDFNHLRRRRAELQRFVNGGSSVRVGRYNSAWSGQ